MNFTKRTLGALAISSSLLLAVSACAPSTSNVAQQVTTQTPGVSIKIGGTARDQISVTDISRSVNAGLQSITFVVNNLQEQDTAVFYSTFWLSKSGQPLGHGSSSVIEVKSGAQEYLTVLSDNPKGYQAKVQLQLNPLQRKTLRLREDDYNAMTSTVVSQFLQAEINLDKLKKTKVFLGDFRNKTDDTSIKVDEMISLVKERLQNTQHFVFTDDMNDTDFKLNLELSGDKAEDGKSSNYKLVLNVFKSADGQSKSYNSLLHFYKK